MVRTQFEDSSSWTTIENERTFVDALLAAHPGKLSRRVLGTSQQGRDLYALRVGTGMRMPVLVQSGTHGNEAAPRETSLSWVRDALEAPSAAVAALLAQRPVWVVPTVNPDGRAANTRATASGVDTNRVAARLTLPEARAHMAFIGDIQPLAGIDMHEIPAGSSGVTTNMQFDYPVHPDLDDWVYTESQRIAGDVIRPATAAAGITSDWYMYAVDSTNAEQIVQVAPLHGFPFVLSEAYVAADPPGGTPVQRAMWERVALDAFLGDIRTNGDAIEAGVVRARGRVATRVARGVTLWAAGFGRRATSRFGAITPMRVSVVGYALTAAEYATASSVLAAHRVYVESDGAGGYVVMLGQAAAALAVRLLDEASAEKLTTTKRLTVAPPSLRRSGDEWASVVHDKIGYRR